MRRRNKRNKKDLKVVDTIEYRFSGVDRINQIPEIEKALRANFLETIILKYVLMTQKQLEAEAASDSLTIIERMVVQQIIQGLNNKNKNAFHYSKYLQDRIAGTVRDRVELSGPDGSAIKIDKEQDIDDFLDTLTDKELLAYEKAMTVISKVRSRHADKA